MPIVLNPLPTESIMAKNDMESKSASSVPFRPTYGTASDEDEDVSGIKHVVSVYFLLIVTGEQSYRISSNLPLLHHHHINIAPQYLGLRQGL